MKEDSKITEFFKKFTDSEQSLKRIPFYFFLICVLLVCLLFKLDKTNKYLEKIAENESPFLEMETIASDESSRSPEVNVSQKETIDDLISTTEKKDNADKIDKNNSKVTTTAKANDKNGSSDVSDNKNKPTSPPQQNDNSSSKTTYVINKSSKKMHTDDCSFVKRMKDENKTIVTLSDSEMNQYLNNGYTLCSTCGG